MKRAATYLSLTVVLALAVVAAGCSAAQAPAPTADEIVTKVRETLKNTTSAQGTADVQVTIDKDGLKALAQTVMPGKAASAGRDWTAMLPDTASATLKVWREAPDKLRVEVESSTLPGVKGATLVRNGDKAYVYNPTKNEVYEFTPGDLSKMPAQLRAMLQNMDPEAMLDKALDAVNVQTAGSEMVGGVDTYKLQVTPRPDAAERIGLPPAAQVQAGVVIKDMSASVWVDKTRWVPVKVTLEHPNMGQLTYEMRDLELNKPIDPSQFVLQAPADAKRVDLDALHNSTSPKSLTIQSARDAAAKEGWSLLEPSYVPEGATLVGVLQVPGTNGNAGYVLNYTSPQVDFSITQIRPASGDTSLSMPMAPQLGDMFSGREGDASKEVDVRGTKGTAFSPEGGQWTSLMWFDESGVWVAIRGKLSLEETLKVAEGMK